MPEAVHLWVLIIMQYYMIEWLGNQAEIFIH